MLKNLDSSTYKEILDCLPYEVFVTDDKGFVLYCNDAFSKNYCYDVDNLLGKHVKTISPSIKKGKAIIPLVIKNKKEISLFQETIHGKKLLLTAKPLLDTDGNIKIIIESGREILNAPHNLNNCTSEDNFLSSPDSTLDSYNPELSVFTNLNNFKALIKIAKYDVTILLLGESGTGKSTCAKFIHASSLRKDQPFITVNCTTIPESLIESELFGYVKGAFTGASKDGKKGLVDSANKGTLFLDEIGDLPLPSQSKLLELIQENTYTPVGGTSKKSANIRIIAATNKNLAQMVSIGSFREDLYYRLNVIEYTLLPLRERKNDISTLSKVLLKKLNTKYNTNKIFSDELLHEISTYDWPGNIRQLEHVLERLIITSDIDTLTMEQVYKHLNYTKPSLEAPHILKFPSLKSHLISAERDLIIAAYNEYKSSYKIAEALGISQSQASRKVRKYLFK